MFATQINALANNIIKYNAYFIGNLIRSLWLNVNIIAGYIVNKLYVRLKNINF